jgi:hypothetical protein
LTLLSEQEVFGGNYNVRDKQKSRPPDKIVSAPLDNVTAFEQSLQAHLGKALVIIFALYVGYNNT